MSRSPASLIASVVLLSALGVSALADLEVELPRGGAAIASLRAPGQTERWLLRVPDDAVVSILIKGTKSTAGERPELAVRLLDDQDAEIARGRSSRKRAKLRGVRVPSSGLYTAEVSLAGAVTGEYVIQATWKSRGRAHTTADVSAGESELHFVADTGATADFVAKGKKGATPVLLRVASADETFSVDLTPPADGAKKHSVKRVQLATGGDYVLTFGGAGGDAKASVRVRPAKASKAPIDLTEAVIDPEETGQGFVRGTVVGPTGGDVAVAPDEGAGLAGAMVQIPAGALPSPVAITVGTGAQVGAPSGEVVSSGPTVQCGPSGQAFAVDARVTIPFDAEPFRGDYSTLQIVQRESDGTSTIVPAGDYDIHDDGFVTFPAKHFTSFRAFGSPPPAPVVIFSDGFENGYGAWYATNGIWEIGEPTAGTTAHSGDACAATVLSGAYPDFTDSSLVSPSMVLPTVGADEEIQLRFWQWFRIDKWDSIRVLVQEELSPGVYSTPAALLTITRVSGVWTESMADVSGLAGKKVKFVFNLGQDSNFSGTDHGYFLDDVSVSVRPVVDASNGDPVVWTFENDADDWWTSGAHWQIGTPTSGPGAAHEGSRAAGTNLAGNYADWSIGTLLSPTVQLPTLGPGEELHLRFWHWLSLNSWDLAAVWVVEELGAGARAPSVRLSTYNLTSGVWSYALVDLSAYAGKRVRVFFQLSQDGNFSGTGPGWFIDEVSIQRN